MPRAVHNIVRMRKAHRVILSYIQHGNREEGFVYENICPFCSSTLEFVEDDDDLYPTEHHMLDHLEKKMVSHIALCPRGGHKPLMVYVSDKALGTEKKPEIG